MSLNQLIFSTWKKLKRMNGILLVFLFWPWFPLGFAWKERGRKNVGAVIDVVFGMNQRLLVVAGTEGGGGGRLMTGPARDIFGLLVTRLLVIKRHRQQERRQRRRVNLLDDQRSEHNKPRKSRPLSRWWGLVTSDTLVPFLCRALFFWRMAFVCFGFFGEKKAILCVISGGKFSCQKKKCCNGDNGMSNSSRTNSAPLEPPPLRRTLVQPALWWFPFAWVCLPPHFFCWFFFFIFLVPVEHCNALAATGTRFPLPNLF